VRGTLAKAPMKFVVVPGRSASIQRSMDAWAAGVTCTSAELRAPARRQATGDVR
jgi:hypothetical protein